MNKLLMLLIEQERKDDELWLDSLCGLVEKTDKPSLVELHAMTLKKVLLDSGVYRFDFSPSVDGFNKLIGTATTEGLIHNA